MTGYINFTLPYTIKKKQSYYVTHCPIVDVYSQGETEAKAVKNLTEAISLFLVSCLERGTLEGVMKACGAQVVSKSLRRIPDRKRTINVPFPITTNCAEKVCHV